MNYKKLINKIKPTCIFAFTICLLYLLYGISFSGFEVLNSIFVLSIPLIMFFSYNYYYLNGNRISKGTILILFLFSLIISIFCILMFMSLIFLLLKNSFDLLEFVAIVTNVFYLTILILNLYMSFNLFQFFRKLKAIQNK